MAFFDSIEMLPEDPILGIPIAVKADKRPNVVNLGVGAYKTAEGKNYVLNSVKNAEAQLLRDRLDKDYLPIDGDQKFLQEIQKLAFGPTSEAILSKRIYSVQTVGGSFALRLAGEFAASDITKNIFIPDPSWQNHHLMFKSAGLNALTYPYFSKVTNGVDFSAMCEAIKQMPAKSLILLQGCCHNPTGADLTMEQWKEISELILKQKVIPFFDLAYQGFGDGIEPDAASLRYFTENHREMFVSYSCSKNFGLYGERIGALHILTDKKEISDKVGSHLKLLIRASYSSPPIHGGRIVSTILTNETLKKEWQTELNDMRLRVVEMREAFAFALQYKVNKDVSFIQKQKGMFSYCGLDQDMVIKLRDEKGIYMPMNGRMNIAGLNMQNMDYVVDAISEVLTN